MARYKTKSGELQPNYHSTDPRQISLPIDGDALPAAGRPAVENAPADAAKSFGKRAGDAAIAGFAYIEASKAAFLESNGSVDLLAEEVKKVTGCGPRLNWAAPSHAQASQLVLVGWDSLPRMKRDGASGTGRAGFFPDARTALRHVLEYERISAAEGKDAAELFHLKARCKSESEAVARMDEEAGVARVDPNRDNPKYKHGDR